MSVPHIPSTMLAARFHGNSDVRVEEVENPALREGEVRVQVAFAGQSSDVSARIKDGQEANALSAGLQESAALTCTR